MQTENRSQSHVPLSVLHVRQRIFKAMHMNGKLRCVCVCVCVCGGGGGGVWGGWRWWVRIILVEVEEKLTNNN